MSAHLPGHDDRIPIEMSDAKVRDLLLKAGFDVTIHDDVAMFARFIRFMFADYESQTRSRDTFRMFLIALGTGTIVALIPVALKLLKVL